LFSPPANKCFSPTRASKTSPSGVRTAKPNALRARPLVTPSGRRPKRPARSAERKLRFLSARRRDARCSAANVSSSGGPWVHRHSKGYLTLPFPAASGLAAGSVFPRNVRTSRERRFGLMGSSTCTKTQPKFQIDFENVFRYSWPMKSYLQKTEQACLCCTCCMCVSSGAGRLIL
jgi:hypothetical protein